MNAVKTPTYKHRFRPTNVIFNYFTTYTPKNTRPTATYKTKSQTYTDLQKKHTRKTHKTMITTLIYILFY